MNEQRIYRGGAQWHDHPPFGERHTEPRLHDGFWLHYHDAGGMVATGSDDDPLPADVQAAFDLLAPPHDPDRMPTRAELEEARRIFGRWVTSDPDGTGLRSAQDSTEEKR